MKTRIVLIFVMLSLSAGVMAQTVYYQTNMVYRVNRELSGSAGGTIEYWCDWDHNTGLMTLYNPRIHRFVYQRYPTNVSDGSPMSVDFFLGHKRMMSMTEQTDPEIQRRVKQAMNTLNSQERAAIGDETVGIELYFDPKTDLPIGVVFTFHRASGWKHVHPHFFRRLEIYLVDQGAITGLTVVPEARSLNFTSLIWRQGVI